MVNKEERLIKLIRREQAGKGGNYEEICELLFDEMNNLVRPVCESAEESKKKVKKLFVRMLQQINEIDTNDDIHLWIAGFSTVTLYEILTKENGQIITYNSGNIDYPYSHIDEDEEFKSKIGDYNDALANPQRYMFAKDFFKKLTKGQIILFEMFCYEGFTVDEIQELLEMDIVLGNVNGNQEIELVSQEDNSLQEEEDSEDIAAIKAAVAAIVSDTEDEVKTETDGYKDIVSAVNAIRSEIDENGVDYSKESDNLGATLVNINKKRINNSLNNNIVSENIPSDNDNKGEFEVDYDKALSSLDSDKGSIDKSDLSIKDNESDNVNSLEKSSEKSDNDTVYSDTSNKGQDIKVSKIEADYIDDDEDEEVNEEEKEDSKKKKGVIGLFGLDDLADDDEYDDDEIEDISDEKSSTKVNSNKSTNKNDNKNNKLLKILSIAIPSVAVVIFIVILLTSGAFKKSSSANNSGTIAETKNSTKKQETTTQEQTTQKETATEKKTQQTTTAKKTESTTQATTQEETTEKQTTATKANSSTVATTQAQTKTTATQTQATTEATTEKATQATTQVTTQATTEATTQATISTKSTQATTAENTTSEETLKATQVTTSSATTATQADTDTIVDEKNGTALH